MKTKTIFLLLLLLAVLSQPNLHAQENPDVGTTLFNHLYTDSDSIIDIRLETDLRLLVRRKQLEEYQPATLTFPGVGEDGLSWEVKIRSRGNIRKSVCFYPPFRLNVKKGDLEEIGFSDSDKIKVVLQCRNGNENLKYLYREYLIYKMYNLLDPVSYRVQLAQFTFTDPSGKRDPEVLMGFLIEPLEELAGRVGAQVVERESASGNMMEDRPYNIMTTFQYMVGNTDWSPRNMHNLSTVKLPEERKMHCIPYDFDYTGTVDAFYAIPAENSGVKSVRDRIYNGHECSDEEAHFIINLFNEKEEDLLDIVRHFPHHDEREVNLIVDYLDDFFQLFENERSATKVLQRR